jgi:pimeloyl-ACP methyl ester carboxylesterase
MSDAHPRSQYVKVNDREIHYMEWGTRGAAPLVMWHGLARSGRDFDTIAAALSDRFHIICPDTIGRGLSEWSDDGDTDYCFDVYAEHARAIADAVGFERMSWLGTSMGGSLGMRVAATTLKGRINKLIINDIGPTFPKPPFERIKQYIGNPPEFGTITEIETYFKEIYQPFGHHTDAQWRHMAETSSRRLPSGMITTHYDPEIVRQMFVHPGDYELWDCYDAISCPTLVLHGVNSDLLLADIAGEMARRGPNAEILEIADCGHAPGLVQDGHIKLVRDWLG